MTPPPSWDDLRWLREQWDGPFMLKGVLRVDDAAERSTPATARSRCLQPRRQQPRWLAGVDPGAARDRRSGRRRDRGAPRRRHPSRRRRGQGARVGREGGDDRSRLPLGLAAAGQAGVENVLDIMRNGIDSALLGLGRASIAELTPDDLIIQPGFTRRVGLVEPAALSVPQ